MYRLMHLRRQQVQSGAVSQPVTMDQFINMIGTVAGADLRLFLVKSEPDEITPP